MKSQLISALKVGTASFVIGAAIFAAPALAADAAAAKKADKSNDDVIVVTGSIVRNKSAATASPVTSISSVDLQDRGITSVADAVQQLSANNAGADPASWTSFGFATGASAPSLRGFNDGYTLTIFNGLRSAPYPLADDGYRNFVDINTIPESIVQSIDTLQDGASSTYGADAIAGVINVITRKEIQGLHINASEGLSQLGDANEGRVDATWGMGKLSRDGYNFYVNAEYQHNSALSLNQRGFPYGSSDLSAICGTANGNGSVAAGGITCMNNGIRNGIQANGAYNGFQSTIVPFVRPYTAPGTAVAGSQYQLLNPAAGCMGLPSVTLTAAQQGGGSTPNTVCQQDNVARYYQYLPEITRQGANARLTKTLGSAEAYVMVNYYETKTVSHVTPQGFANQTAAGGIQDTLGQVYLPVYVCPQGVGTLTGSVNTSTGCTAANGTLNPNNPFAAAGNLARLSGSYDLPTTSLTDAKTFRVSGGISGSFGKGWNYDAQGTYSSVALDVTQLNDINLQHLMTAIAQGTYNFATPSANSQAARDFIAPPSFDHSISKLSQFQATLNHDFVTLPGGPLNVAVGGEYRYEAIHNPSANPANNVNPADRAYGINSVGVDGSRNVWGGFYEISIPILNALRVKADGRYDKYSSGQSSFSPKFEAVFQPIKQIKVRGTYSKGFKIPSFNQAYGLPTTGYVTTQINCANAAAFCAAHANNPSYYQGGYSYGLTSTGNPGLNPEKSESYTVGVVLAPTSRLTVTVDYWHTKISNIIIPAVASQTLINQYYQNNGTVNVPGFTVTQGVPDQSNPNALPLLGNVSASFINADSEIGSGIDFTALARFPIGHGGVKLISNFNASYLMKLELTDPGTGLQVYAGSLSPCNITSCSGAPKWRGSWENKLDFNGKASLALTAYYTSGYDLASTDYGGVIGDCLGSIGASVVTFTDGATPVSCKTHATFNLDMSASVKVAERFTLYGSISNLLNNKPPFDPSAGYSLYQFNPAWGDKNFIGRYFRIGAKVDF
jgi:iron complex outermembrane receptor protein